jgi:hypothetical protein
MRRKTLVVVEKTGTGNVPDWQINPWERYGPDWQINPWVWYVPGWQWGKTSQLGDYSASGIDDEVQTLVMLNCHFETVGYYTNGGDAQKHVLDAQEHVCDGEINDIADPATALRVGVFTVRGGVPPSVIDGQQQEAIGAFAFLSAAKWVAQLDRK